jgi:RecB family endonuclease NucS
MPRRIIRIDGSTTSVARESPFESEAKLHDAVTSHPEILPSEDLNLGFLVTLATELDLGSGPMDLLAADAQGRLVIVEFKR